MANKGYIYIMTNPALPNTVKIGYATDVEKRRKQLSTTNLPYDYEVFATYETTGKMEDKKLHKMIDSLNPDLRVSPKREFYALTADDAYALLEAVATISGTLSKLKKVKTPASQRQSVKKPPINFSKCHIPVGAKLVFIKDPSVVATVHNDRKVMYNGNITSLSSIAESILGYNVQGPVLFTYKGKKVSDIAKETQWKSST